MLSIQKFGDWARLEYLLTTYEERLNFARENIVKVAAEKYLEMIQDRLRKVTDKEFKIYAESLRLVTVKTDDKKTIVAIESKPESVSLEERDNERTVLSFVAKSRRRLNPLSSILVDAGPWTMDTVPAIPLPDVQTIYHYVTKDEVNVVRKRVLKKADRIRQEMIRAGLPVRQERVDPAELGKVEAKADTSLIGLRLEFGLAGYPHVPHWGPTYREMQRSWRSVVKENMQILRVLVSPEATNWSSKAGALPIVAADKLVGYSRFVAKIRGA